MAKLTITSGHPQLDGVYELDLSAGLLFTKDEWFLMQKRVGVTMEDLQPGAPLNMNVMTAFGLVLLHRAGKQYLFNAFMATTDAQTDWDWADGEVEVDQEDPAVPLATGSEDAATSRGRSGSSGSDTNGHSELSPATTLEATGSRP